MDRKSSGKSSVPQSQNNLDTFGYLPNPDIDLGRESGNEPESGARNQQEDHGENYLEGNLHYVQTGILGKGSFAVVVKAVDLVNQKEVAIKLLPRGQLGNYRTYVKREIHNHSGLRHPHVVGLCEVFLMRRYIAIVMEYAAGGNLYKYVLSHSQLRRLPEEQARWIFQQLILGLEYCHIMGVANRDLKLENILLDRRPGDLTQRPLVKICDFGYSKNEQSSAAKSSVGTPVYMAPEIILGWSRKVEYDAKKSDIWSCGVILYAMLFGRYPFDARDPKFAQNVVNAMYLLPADVPISADCSHLLHRMLSTSSAQRISVDEIKRHVWFLEGLPPGALNMNSSLPESLLPPGAPSQAGSSLAAATRAATRTSEQNLRLLDHIVELAFAEGTEDETEVRCVLD